MVGSHGDYTTKDFRLIMSERIIHLLTDFFAENRFSNAEIDAYREEIGFGVSDKLNADFVKLGFRITDFRIEGTDFDEETRKRINRIADISAEAQAAQSAGINFTQLQQLEAMREAARNEGGGADAGMDLRAGIDLGQSMARAIQWLRRGKRLVNAFLEGQFGSLFSRMVSNLSCSSRSENASRHGN